MKANLESSLERDAQPRIYPDLDHRSTTMNRDDLATIQDLTNSLSAAEEDLSSFLFALANIIADELENMGVDIASLRHSSPQDTTQPESRDSDTNSAGVILVDEQREGILPVESIPLATPSTSMPSGAYRYRDMSFGQHKATQRSLGPVKANKAKF